MTGMFRFSLQFLLLVCLAIGQIPYADVRSQHKAVMDAGLLRVTPGEAVSFWVFLRNKARLETNGTWTQRGENVVAGLRDTAERTQVDLRAYLDARGLTYRSFWIANSIFISGDAAAAAWMQTRPEVGWVVEDKPVPLIAGGDKILTEPTPDVLNWNLGALGLPGVWDEYQTRGEGIVVATIDSGLQYDHVAIREHYRGYQAGLAAQYDHAYNWFDGLAGIAGMDQCSQAGVPCDTVGHGTHVAGIIAGETADQMVTTGVAPGVKLISARACDAYSCSRAALLAAGEWMLAPTDLNGLNPRPDLRPQVINNSWGGPGDDLFFQSMVAAWDAAGIFSVFSAGNNGPDCGTINYPGSYVLSTAVGAVDSNSELWSKSSRGPTQDGRVKPDLAAPGVAILSAYPTRTGGSGYVTMSGTSMAAPHVSGAIALLWSKFPELHGNPIQTRWVLAASTAPAGPLDCGGSAQRNNDFGSGRLDIAVLFSLAQSEGYIHRLFIPIIRGD